MAMNDLENLHDCLAKGLNAVEVDKGLAERSMLPLQRMLDFAK